MALLGAGRCLLPPKPFRRGQLTVTHARKVRSKKQVAVSRTLIAKQGHEADVASLAGEILKWSQQEVQGQGKGIIMFDCVRDGWESNTFHFWERYETTDAFGNHSTAPHMVELLQKLQPHLEGPMGIALYSYEDGRLGPACIQDGPKGEGGLDDATGASGAAGGASYKQTSRAFDLTKVDEHEEASRERDLMASMSVDADAAAGAGANVQPEQADAIGGSKPETTKVKARSPLPSVGDLLTLAVDVKNSVMSTLCRLFKH